MAKRSGRYRATLVMMMLAAAVIWASGCTAGGSISLSTLMTAEGKGALPEAELSDGGQLSGETEGHTASYVPDHKPGGLPLGGKGDASAEDGPVASGGKGGGSGAQEGAGGMDTTGAGAAGSGTVGGRAEEASRGNTGTADSDKQGANASGTDENGAKVSGEAGTGASPSGTGDIGANPPGTGEGGANSSGADGPGANPSDTGISGGKTGGKSEAAGNKTGQDDGEGAAKPDKEIKRVALTFDDGPDLRYTTAILDILKDEGVKATFFVVGIQVEKYPEVVQRMAEEGHVVGNHTQGHKDLSKLSRSQMLAQIEEADKAIQDALGVRPSLFRAPYGAVSDALKKELAKQERRLVGWTVDTRDWAGTSVADMREMIRNDTKPDGIILMHSFGGKHIANTVEMLPDVIRDLRELGFTFVTVDEIP